MPSMLTFSEHVLSHVPAVPEINIALARIAQARTADPIVFLEIIGRGSDVTEARDVVEGLPDSGLRPFSSVPVSALYIPHSTRNTQTFLFSTRPWCGRPEDAIRPNQRAIPRIITAGRISRSIPVEVNSTRRSQRTIGSAQIANPDGALDQLLTAYSFVGEKIRVWLAEPGENSDSWALLYEAVVAGIEATRTEIRIDISTIAGQLERPYQLRRYTGSGGLSGDSAVAGRLKPIGMGDIWGAAPVQISEADGIWQVHDGRIYAFDWVSEGGVNFKPTQDYPDYDSLRFAGVELGQYATCLAQGLFKPGISIGGLVYPLRVGFKGDATGRGYLSSTGDILRRIARDRAFLSSRQLDLSSFSALPSQSIGYYFDGSSSQTVAQVFDELLQAVGGSYGVGRASVISVQRLLPAEFRLDDLTIQNYQTFDEQVQSLPYTPRDIQLYSYAPAASPLSENEISPLADSSTAKRLVEGSLNGVVSVESETHVPPSAQTRLKTYFVDDEPAKRVAEAALVFASTNNVSIRSELGRMGLLAELGNIVSIEDARFAKAYRGVVYEQEDNLGATITSRVVTLG